MTLFMSLEKVKPKSPLIYYFGDGVDETKLQDLEASEGCDDDVLKMEPVIKPKPR